MHSCITISFEKRKLQSKYFKHLFQFIIWKTRSKRLAHLCDYFFSRFTWSINVRIASNTNNKMRRVKKLTSYTPIFRIWYVYRVCLILKVLRQTSLLLCEKVLWWASEWSPFTVFSPKTQIIDYSGRESSDRCNNKIIESVRQR